MLRWTREVYPEQHRNGEWLLPQFKLCITLGNVSIQNNQEYIGDYMKILKVQFEYIWSGDDAERKARIAKRYNLLRQLEIHEVPEELDEKNYTIGNGGPFIVTDAQLLTLMINGEVAREVHQLFEAKQDKLELLLESAIAKFEKIAANPTDTADEHHNHKTESPISNVLLHSYNQVAIVEDACTDHLQNSLNDGWRIIAVCPQPQRRPDYVLARFNQDFVNLVASQLPDRAVRP